MRAHGREAPPGGEPLWIAPKRPSIFIAACGGPETSLNRRLPGTFQRVLGLLGPLTGMTISEPNAGQNMACGNSREPLV